MPKRMGALVTFARVFGLFFSSNVLAQERIENTDVIVLPEGEYQTKIEVDLSANYSWGLLNSNNATHLVNISFWTGNTDVNISISSDQIQLLPMELREFYVVVGSGDAEAGDIATINVTFNATNLVTGESGEQTFITVTEIFAPEQATEIPTVIIAFVAVAAIIFIGFFATLIFQRTRVPDLLILVILGLILGPIATTYFGVELVPHYILDTVMPYFAALALVIILFDGGLNLNFDLVLRKINIAFIHTMVAFILTIVSVALVAHLILGYPLIIGILLGCVLGGISGAVVITLVRKMKISEETKTVLTLESVLTDVMCIIVALALIEFIIGTEDPAGAVTSLFAGFSIAFFVGLIFGIAWLRILRRLYGKPFSFMITIAALFLLYGLVEFVGGSGAMSALIFGLVLGNKEEIARMFKIKTKFVIDEKIKQFHSELSFVVRTFFFVFIGLVFTLSLSDHMAVTTPIPGLNALNNSAALFILGVIIIFIVLMVTRYLASVITTKIHPESRDDRFAIWVMMGRGLAAAVLASLPFTIAAFREGTAYFDLMSPYREQFLNIAFLIIVLSVVVTTIGVVSFERRGKGLHPLDTEKMRLERKQESLKKKELKAKMDQERRIRIQKKKHRKRIEERKKPGE
ncbi:MAG: cation:proton antiporter [Methanobacteriota archaeon]|nr:MAG: cation:proton antiporter [Euryarchaeota archaeon]